MRRLVWLPPGILVAGAAYNVALALGVGSDRIRHYHEAPGRSVVDVAAFAAFVLGLVLAGVAVARPHRGIAAYAPALAAYMITLDLTYDSYYAPQLERYWSGAGGTTRIYLGAALAIGVGIGTAWRPREGSVTTALALPVVLITTIAYLGH